MKDWFGHEVAHEVAQAEASSSIVCRIASARAEELHSLVMTMLMMKRAAQKVVLSLEQAPKVVLVAPLPWFASAAAAARVGLSLMCP